MEGVKKMRHPRVLRKKNPRPKYIFPGGLFYPYFSRVLFSPRIIGMDGIFISY